MLIQSKVTHINQRLVNHTTGDTFRWIGVHAQDRGHTEVFERLVDRYKPWISIHRVRKNRSLCWTHYLCQDDSLKVLKCKHCGGLLVHIGKDRSSTSRFRSHLKHHHRIDPNSNYYAEVSLPPISNKNTLASKEANKHEAESKYGVTVASGTSKHKLNPKMGIISSNHQTLPKERYTALKTELLLGIMTASHDLRHEFFSCKVTKEILARLPDLENLNLPAAILHTSQHIDEIINRTIKLNEESLGEKLIIESDVNIDIIKLQITERIQTLSQITFFSISHRHWHSSGLSASFINFFDWVNLFQYTLLVEADRIHAVPEFDFTIPSAITSHYKGLQRFVVSNMTPNISTEDEVGNWNVCITSELQRCFSLLFGEITSSKLPDTVMSLDHVTIINPLLIQIQRFLKNVGKEWQESIPSIDITNYSQVIECITFLLKSRSLLDLLDPAPFSASDYLDMVYFTEIAQGFNKLLQLFTSATKQTWQYILVAVVALDDHLSEILSQMEPNSKMYNQAENCLSAVSKYKKRLLTQDHYLLASFLVPTFLFDDELIKLFFQTDSLDMVIDLIVEMTCVLLIEYINIGFAEADNGISINQSRDEFDHFIKDLIRSDIYGYLKLVDEIVPAEFQIHCSKLGINKKMTANSKFYVHDNTPLSSLDILVDISIPVTRNFYTEKWNSLGPITRFLFNLLNAQPSSTISLKTSFMANYTPISSDSMLRDILKIKSLELQFNSTEIDFDNDNIPLLCKFASKEIGP